jgi:hypothetical protein
MMLCKAVAFATGLFATVSFATVPFATVFALGLFWPASGVNMLLCLFLLPHSALSLLSELSNMTDSVCMLLCKVSYSLFAGIQ